MPYTYMVIIILTTIIISCLCCYYKFNYKLEGLDNTAMFEKPSCGIANDDNNCNSCEDVVNAYMKKGLIYNKKRFKQCL